MKLAIVGCRHYNDYHRFCSELAAYDMKNVEIVSGGCTGVDKLAEKYAHEKRIPVTIFHANWNKFGRRAGPIRNKKLVEYSDAVIAFWDGKSTGTKNTINIAKKEGKPIVIVSI